MKKKRSAFHKKYPHNASILCAECGNREFKRTLSETDSIVRLAGTQYGKALKETIVVEGKIRFRYQCARCDALLLQAPEIA